MLEINLNNTNKEKAQMMKRITDIFGSRLQRQWKGRLGRGLEAFLGHPHELPVPSLTLTVGFG